MEALCLTLACLWSSERLYITGELLHPLSGKPYHWCYGPCHGPLAELRIGMQATLRPDLTVDYGFRHTSFPLENDRGQESFYISATWRPLK